MRNLSFIIAVISLVVSIICFIKVIHNYNLIIQETKTTPGLVFTITTGPNEKDHAVIWNNNSNNEILIPTISKETKKKIKNHEILTYDEKLGWILPTINRK